MSNIQQKHQHGGHSASKRGAYLFSYLVSNYKAHIKIFHQTIDESSAKNKKLRLTEN